MSLCLAACGGEAVPPDGDAGAPPARLHDGAEVSYAVVYEAVERSLGFAGTRPWIPVDVAPHPAGELWVVQRLARDPAFDDESECTSRGLLGGANDCASLEGSTVAIREPRAAEPATDAAGRANLVVDANAWHFMRRPSAIAFGARELRLEPSDPGADGANLTETAVFTDTFATCHEHWTANPTDQLPFIGPTLWTSDPAIYNGVNGSFEWSNGSHLDMVHATQYCMGIAYERDNVYWTLNGPEGTLDRYDFAAPHFPGHHDHDDGDVTRFYLRGGATIARRPEVPSNVVIAGADLYVADTGNGRVLHIDVRAPATEFGTFRTHEGYEATAMEDLPFDIVLDSEALRAAWGGAEVEPSGLALLDADTLVVANHASGHISLFTRAGAHLRTLDTGTGRGIGGLTVLDGVVYFVQMQARRVLRIDVRG
ncbi:MAG: hypothetical protein KF729_03290 [Sandaracinaceae bacterium]|nr:hypothetical protein [Sandaracinaceae bacterium]